VFRAEQQTEISAVGLPVLSSKKELKETYNWMEIYGDKGKIKGHNWHSYKKNQRNYLL